MGGSRVHAAVAAALLVVTGLAACGDDGDGDGAAVTTTRPPGMPVPLVVDTDLAAEGLFGATCLAPHTGQVLRSRGDLQPTTLAVMHGSSFQGDGKQALYQLAARYESLIVHA